MLDLRGGYETNKNFQFMASFRVALLSTAATALSLAATPAALADPLTFTSKTSGNSGLASNNLLGVYANGNNIYAATIGNGLSISTNGGSSWTNYTTSNGLGSNDVRGVYAMGNSWTNYTNGNTSGGLGSGTVTGIYAIGSNIYASIDGGGLSISSNGGTNWTNYRTTNGLAGNNVTGVYASSTSIYAATQGGLSIAQQSDPTPSAVPGPLPLFGAASAFGFSRKLRRRLRTAATVSPCC